MSNEENRETVIIRPVTRDDAAALAAIYAPYVKETTVTFEYEAPDEREFARRIAEIAPLYPYLCAVIDGRIAGYAYAHRYGERKAYDWAVIMSVYVDRACRRQGVGQRLYAALLQLLAQQHVQSAYAIVSMPNEASDRFHRALGFSHIATNSRIGYKMNRWLDTQTYVLELGEHRDPPEPVIPFSAIPPATVAACCQA